MCKGVHPDAKARNQQTCQGQDPGTLHGLIIGNVP